MAELITSAAGGVLLHLKGYVYYKHSGNFPETVYWRCRRQDECKGRVVSKGTRDNMIVTKEFPHCHGPNHKEVASLRVISRMKRVAQDSSGSNNANRIKKCTFR